jgi:hypothetical protein
MRTQSICLALVIVLLYPYASAQWVQTNGPNGADIRRVARSGPNLFAGTYKGVFLSTDNGTNWTEVNSGVPVDILGDYPLVPVTCPRYTDPIRILDLDHRRGR